jgi:hypothetical protein
MSQNSNDGFDPNDPLSTWRTIRDANLDAWAKGMAAFTGTDTFAKAIGMQLDTLLASSAPVKQAVNDYMESYLAQVNMPSRSEVVSLAGRLTNIELRLDDMQSQLDQILAALHGLAVQPQAAPAQPVASIAALPVEVAEPAPAKPRGRSRKPAVE